MSRQLDFDEAVPVDRGDHEPALIVDIDGFAGPLDLLLELARRQKVDLHKISVLALAEQYLAFIEQARRFRLEFAADYLVMAAWLAFLKSRLLLPEPAKDEEPSAQELASVLAFRLKGWSLSAKPRAGSWSARALAAMCSHAACPKPRRHQDA